MKQINFKIIEDLKANQDLKYKSFQEKLIPNIDKNSIIGVRTKILRELAKKYAGDEEISCFINSTPHKFFEENQLHSFIISKTKDYNKCIEQIEEFLPFIDNWAVCDQLSPEVFKNNKNRLIKNIYTWINSDEIYTVRFAIGMLLKYYLDENFKEEYLKMVAKIDKQEYYIQMMVAWYFATALAKQYDFAITYIENRKLDYFTHNKTIQKAIESYRETKEHKEYLKTLKIIR